MNIANGLIRNQTIVYLNLHSCCITDIGAQHLAVALLKPPAGGRSYNTTLQVLGALV